MGPARNVKLVIAACLASGLVALGGCRDDEQDRMIHLEKGQYPGGNPSEALSEEALGEMRMRARSTQGYN